MGLKLNATNGGGSVELDVPDTVSSDITFTLPSALGSNENIISTDASGNLSFVGKGVKIVNVYSAQTYGRSTFVTVSASTDPQPGSLYGQPQGRYYADVETITFTPEKSTNKLLFFCTVGWTALTGTSTKGAHGAMLVKDDSTSHSYGDYPRYTGLQEYTTYPVTDSFTELIDAGDTSSHTFDLKIYAYNETTGDDTHTIRCRDSSLICLELEP